MYAGYSTRYRVPRTPLLYTVLVVLHYTLSFHILGGRGARGGELVGMSRVSAGLLSHISLAVQQSLPGCVRVKALCSKVIVLQAWSVTVREQCML